MHASRAIVPLLVACACGQGGKPPPPAAPDAAAVAARSPADAAPPSGDRVEKVPKGEARAPIPDTPVTCDAAGKPSRAWAYQQYVREGGEKVPDTRDVELFADTDVPGVFLLALRGGPHQPAHHRLARVFRCRLYDDDAELQQAILLDWGWKDADPAKRVELAEKLDRGMNDVVTEAPADWDAKHAFTAPEAKPLPGGGVRLVRWRGEERVISSSLGGRSDAGWVREQIELNAAGKPGKPKRLERTP